MVDGMVDGSDTEGNKLRIEDQRLNGVHSFLLTISNLFETALSMLLSISQDGVAIGSTVFNFEVFCSYFDTPRTIDIWKLINNIAAQSRFGMTNSGINMARLIPPSRIRLKDFQQRKLQLQALPNG